MATPTQQTLLYPQILSVGLGANSLDFVDIASGALGHRVKANIAVDDLNEYFQWGRSGNSAVGAISDLVGFQKALNCSFDDGFTDLDSMAQGLSFTTGALANRNNKTGTINDIITAYILFAVYGASSTDTSNKFFNITNLKTMLTDDVVSGTIGASITENSGSDGFVDKMFQYLVSSDPVRFVRNGMIAPMNPEETSGTWSFIPGDLLQFVLKFQFNAPVTQVTLGLNDMNNVVGVANNQAPVPRVVIPTGQIFCITLQLQATATRSPRRIAQLAALASPPAAPRNVTLAKTTIVGELLASWTAPLENGSPSVSLYDLNLTGSDGSVIPTVSIPAPGNIHLFVGLNTAILYTLNIVANNSNGSGPSASSNSVGPLINSPPSAPTLLNFAATANPGELAVSWTASADLGGYQSVDTYKIYLFNSSDATQNQIISTPDLSYILTGLNSAALYTVQIGAVNPTGESAPSAVSGEVSPLGS